MPKSVVVVVVVVVVDLDRNLEPTFPPGRIGSPLFSLPPPTTEGRGRGRGRGRVGGAGDFNR